MGGRIAILAHFPRLQRAGCWDPRAFFLNNGNGVLWQPKGGREVRVFSEAEQTW